jgi:FlaA1/EpsC-like NDP-sugar epimerase
MKDQILRFIVLRKYRIALLILDIIFITLAIYLAAILLDRPKPSIIFYFTAGIIWLVIASLFLLYSAFRYSIRQIPLAIISAWIVLNLATLYIDLLKIARATLLILLPLMIFFILGYRLLLRWANFLMINKKDMEEVKVLILGVGEKAREIARHLENSSLANYNVVGFLSPKH